MATYISTADGNFTSTGTWAQVETGATQTLNGFSSSSSLTPSYSAAFTGTNGNVCDGVMLYVARGSVNGTYTVVLSADGGTTQTRTVTVNSTDVPLTPSYMFFKFSTPLTFTGATTYVVGVYSSVAANVSTYNNGGTTWTKYVRITTTASALAAGDVFFIPGEWTAASTFTTRTVTMDNTTNTNYGAVNICKDGVLTYGTSAATNYVLTLAASLTVYFGGTLNIGTSATPIPRTSTAVLEFVCASAGQYGLILFGTCNMYGQSRTAGKDVVQCKLTADAAAGATSLTVDTDTGWLSGDALILAPTARTPGSNESKALGADATATTLTISTTLTNARSGTSPAQGEIGLLTRNVIFRATGSTTGTASYLRANNGATCNFYWVNFYNLGTNTSGTYGLNISTPGGGGGAFNMSYCTIQSIYYRVHFSWGVAGAVVTNNIFFNIGNSVSTYAIFVGGPGATISNNLFVACAPSTNASYGIYFSVSTNNTFDNNVITASGCSSGALTVASSSTFTSFSGNVYHTNSYALYITGTPGLTIDNLTCYRNGTYGVYAATSSVANVTVQNSTLFGNLTANAYSFTAPGPVKFISCSMYSEASYATTYGIYASDITGRIELYNCSLSPVGKTAHTYDVGIVNYSSSQITLSNCLLGAATEVFGQANLVPGAFISSAKHDQTAGAHKTWLRDGVINRDTTIYNTAAPSERLTPNVAATGNKLPSGSRIAAIDSSGTLTVSVYIRKSAAGDGAAYNGSQPRLIVKRNDAVGITADTVLATYTGSTGSWAQISGTTSTATDDGALEFYVDCDGTAGWINIDDWSVT